MTLNGEIALILRYFKVTDFGTNRKLIYDFLLVISTNLPHILHVSETQHSKGENRYISLPRLRLNPRRRGFPGTISVKFFVHVNGWPRYQTAKKNCGKFQPTE